MEHAKVKVQKQAMLPVPICEQPCATPFVLPTELHYPPMPLANVASATAAYKQLPWIPARPEQMEETITADNWWTVRLPIRPFRPEEVTFTIVRDTDMPFVLIKCRRTEATGQLVKDKRMVFIPRHVDLARITVTVTRDCFVIIRAPCLTALNAAAAYPVVPSVAAVAPVVAANEELLKKKLLKTVVPLECFEKEKLAPELARLREEMIALRRELVPRGLDLIRLVRLPNREYELRLDFILSLFKAHEVKVTVNQKRTIVIDCHREVKVFENTEMLRTTFHFEIPLPRCCEIERMHSVMKPTGCLRITLPCLFKEELPLDGVIVPIKKA